MVPPRLAQHGGVLTRTVAARVVRNHWNKACLVHFSSTATTPTSLLHQQQQQQQQQPPPPIFHWLDLRDSGLSILERLLLEECLLHSDRHRSWLMAGHHDAGPHRYLDNNNNNDWSSCPPPNTLNMTIVMGIGNKAELVLDCEAVQKASVPIIRRFTGGGTVVLDQDSIWTTVIGRPHPPPPLLESPVLAGAMARPATTATATATTSNPTPTTLYYPKQVLEYSTERFIRPLFERLQAKQLQQQQQHHNAPPPPDHSTTTFLPFSLQENDYCLGDYKVAGNAMHIGQHGWLHHTSFLWNYQHEHMQQFLVIPTKRPKYRQARTHDQFLLKLQHHYPNVSKSDVYTLLHQISVDHPPSPPPSRLPFVRFEPVTVEYTMALVQQAVPGGLSAWWNSKSCRTRLWTTSG
jgi:lipoate-protein ligase A